MWVTDGFEDPVALGFGKRQAVTEREGSDMLPVRSTKRVERSTKSVAQKLGVKEVEKAVAINVPQNVQLALGKTFITQTGAPRAGEFDLVLYFATDKVLLGKDLPQIEAALKSGGRLWIGYPKGKAVKTDFNRDTLNAFLQQRKWQGISLVAIDDVWAAMRFKPR